MLNRLKLNAIDAFKFFITIALPLSIWFISLKHDVDINTNAIAKVDNQVNKAVDKQEIVNDKILEKLELIQKDVATIRGELKHR